MPLPKRILIHNADLAKPDQLLENESPIDLPTANFSRLLGTMRKLTILSTIAMETFTNIGVLLEDISERTTIVANRTDATVRKLVEVEKGLRRLDLQPENNVISYGRKYFKKRQVTIPPLFIKSSNYSAIKVQYKLCKEPPQLWRLENIVGDDLFQFFSFPGYFFQEWLRAELFKQERAKALRKANKALKKQQKKEKKRKMIESQKIRSKSFIVRPNSMKLVDKDRLSNSGSVPLVEPTTPEQAQISAEADHNHHNQHTIRDTIVTSNRPVSTAAAKLFADSPEAAPSEVDDGASDIPTKKKKGGLSNVFGLFRKDKDSTATASGAAAAGNTAAPQSTAEETNNWETSSIVSYNAVPSTARPLTAAISLPHQQSQRTPSYSATHTHTHDHQTTDVAGGEGAAGHTLSPHSLNALSPENDPVNNSALQEMEQDFLQLQVSSSSAAKRRKQQQQLVANKYASKFQAKTGGDMLMSSGGGGFAGGMDDEHRPISLLPSKRQPPPAAISTASHLSAPAALNKSSLLPSSLLHHEKPQPTTNEAALGAAGSETASSSHATKPAAKKRSSVLFATNTFATSKNTEHAPSSQQKSAEEALLQTLLGADYHTVMLRDTLDDSVSLLDSIEVANTSNKPFSTDTRRPSNHSENSIAPSHKSQKTHSSSNSKHASHHTKRNHGKDEDDDLDIDQDVPPAGDEDDDMPPPRPSEWSQGGSEYLEDEEEEDIPHEEKDEDDEYQRNKDDDMDMDEDDDDPRPSVQHNKSPPPPPRPPLPPVQQPQQQSQHQQPPPPQPQAKRAPPPPPPAKQLKSALGTSVLDTIRSGAPALRKVDPAEVMKAKTPDLRTNILNSIKQGGKTLRHVSAQDRVKVTAAQQNEAIQRLLANRRDIAGSDSEDSDSEGESEFSF